MWKLMIFGVFVQLVLLVSILDVNVYDESGGGSAVPKHCLRYLMVISIEGLAYDDIVIALNKSEAVRDLIKLTATYNVKADPWNNATNHTSDDQSGSVFDGQKVLYVGPPASPYEFNTSLWDFILIHENNMTHNLKNHSSENDTDLLDDQLAQQMLSYGSYMLNRRVIVDHMRRIVGNERMFLYPIKFINIGRSGPSDELMTEDERVWFFTKVYEVIQNASQSSDYIFAITSSMNMLVKNYPEDRDNDTLLILGRPACIFKECTPFFEKTLGYEDAFFKLKSYAVLSSFKKEIPTDYDSDLFLVEGNILEFIGGRALEIQKMYMNLGLYFTGWETFHAILNALEVLEIEISPLVLACTVFISLMWIGFLCIKTIKLAVDSYQTVEEVNSTLLKLLNAVCLALIVVMCVALKCSGCPSRYLIYITVAVLVFRLLCGEIFSSVGIQMECSPMDKVKIGLQLFVLISVIECLFWSILYTKILLVVFVLAAFARILQGALSVMRYKAVIAFSLATLFIGLQYTWSFKRFGILVNLNVSACIWAVASIAAIKFLMEKSTRDRFVMFVCVIEHLMALSFANVFWIYGLSFYSVVPVVGFFMGVSLTLPLFGGTDPKNRLLELAAATSAVFVFFSCNGESFFLLFSFIACFCSYMMDRATAKKLQEDEDYYINILPAIFHAVLLVLACHIVTPEGGEAIMRAYTLLNVDSHYQVVASGIFYFMKLGFLVNLLEATFLSSGKKLLALPNLFVVVIILNLISFRSVLLFTYSTVFYLPSDFNYNGLVVIFYVGTFYLGKLHLGITTFFLF